jgi:hypothetical protein
VSSLGRAFCCITLALLPAVAWGHAFGEPYKLPMPYWLYIYGAMAALVLSFLLLGYFYSEERPFETPPEHALGEGRLVAWSRRLRLIPLLQGLTLAAFALAIVTGYFGNQDPQRNFSMHFFWIAFALGVTYLSALLGNGYAVLGPWQVLAALIGRVFKGFTRGRFAYPAWLAYWPALLLYMVFIGQELMGDGQPRSLAIGLLIYTGITLTAVWCFGARAWFRYGEFFTVLFRLVAMMAPVAFRPEETGRRRLALRWPFTGLLHQRVEHFSLLIFVLFMLSATAFDGLRDTALWFNLFWTDPLGVLTPLLGQHPIYAYLRLRPWFVAWEIFWLVASPFLYFGLMALFLWLGRLLTRSPLSVMELALRFGYSFIPIAVVYHVTHYYTLLFSEGVKLRALVSDPFGWGWNLFGTAITGRVPLLPDMGLIWYSQVGLILLGHVASVYLAHAESLRSFPGRHSALLSQLPMLVLMVIFTGVGLWILAQPLQG